MARYRRDSRGSFIASKYSDMMAFASIVLSLFYVTCLFDFVPSKLARRPDFKSLRLSWSPALGLCLPDTTCKLAVKGA